MTEREIKDGVWPTVLTPFREDGKIDFPAYRKLIEYYIANGVAGLFAVCLSSEMYQLTAQERLELARETVAAVAGRVPVVACGYLGGSEKEKLQAMFDIASCNVDAVVIPVCQLVPQEADDVALRRAFEKVLAATGKMRLGLYECPVPHHRLIPPALLGELARMADGRLVFLKDTCCDAAVIREKLAACAGTSLKLFNANLVTCLDSLKSGAAGYCGTSANFYPALLAEEFACFRKNPKRAQELQEFFNLVQLHVDFQYPRSAKQFLKECGVPMSDFCRLPCDRVAGEHLVQLKTFQSFVEKMRKRAL